MAVKFLDNTGLGYFWSKIKAWCNATFAAITHNQASNTINVMTGYSKPNSTSAITSSDTLNQAVGKLEKAIDDADISNTVHVLGNEFIGGIKEFGNSYYDSTIEGETDFESSSLIIRYQNYIKGSGAPSANKHANLLFLDKIGNNVNWSGRLGAVESAVNSSGTYGISIACYKNEIIDNSDTHDRAMLSVGYDINDIKYASCPSTSESRNAATDILTRDWIPKDTRIVHTTENEVVNGRKTFNPSLDSGSTFDSAYTIFRNTAFDRTAPEVGKAYYNSIIFGDSSHNVEAYNSTGRMGLVGFTVRSDGSSCGQLTARYYKSGTSFENDLATLEVGFSSDGTAYAGAPSTPVSGTLGTDIVTRDFIPNDTRIVHTTENETISGIKYFNNTIRTGMSLQYRNSTLTRGVVPSENKYYTLAFYDKDGYAVANRFGLLEVTVLSNGSINVGIGAYKNIANTNTVSGMGVGWDTNGIAYGYAPSTSTSRSVANDIVTRDFIPQDTRIVHTTGNDTISGIKYFNDPINLRANYNCIYRHIENYTVDQLPGTLNWVGGFIWRDKNSRFIAGIEPYIDTTHLDYNLSLTGCSTTGSFQTGIIVSIKHTGGEEVLRPRYNNQMTLGNSNFRWKQLYAVTATISTSDERLKSNIGIISEDVLDAWEDVDWVQFQFKDAVAEKGIEARLHAGLIAQHIIDIFSKHNLDRNRYAFFCYDSWDAIPEKLDKDGNVLDKAIPAGDVYSIRYEEALCVEAAYQRRKNKILENRISELEKQVSDMLQILQSLKGAN